jgi:hypothetical protein
VSEYQYYEFRTIDRGLTEAEMDALRSISTRAEITSTSFTNHYEWGDLKADPLKLLENYFDAFVYVANWGHRHFFLRLPESWFDYKELTKWLPGEAAWVKRTNKNLIVGFEAEIDMEEWDDGTSWMGSLVSLRSDLLRGDLRCLYLGWLLCVQNQEVADKKPSPPVPPGLGQLSASLESLINFLDINEDLVAVAAVTSEPLSAGPSPDYLNIWIRSLPENEKNDLLVTAVSESGDRWRNELLRRFYRENKPPTSPAIVAPQSTAGDLRLAAQARAEETARRIEADRIIKAARQKEKDAAERARYLDLLAKREAAVWDDVLACIQTRQPKGYNQAIQLLIDLRDLAIRKKHEAVFQAKIENLRVKHAAKVSFLQRLERANL